MTTPGWWHLFFDDAYGDFGLEALPDARNQSEADCILRTLDVPEGGLIFDQCCGLGRLSLPLARRGRRIVGVDLSETYIQRAVAAAAAEPEVDCSFHCADAYEFVPGESCDGAFNWFSSYGYSEDDAQNLRMLQRAHDALKPGARFAIEGKSTLFLISQFQKHQVLRHPLPDGGELLVIVETTLDHHRGMIDHTWTRIYPDGRRESHDLRMPLLFPHELARQFRDVGFSDVEFYGGADGSPLDRLSRRCIVVGKKES